MTRLFWPILATLLLAFLLMVHSILLPFVLGMLVAYFLNPAAEQLEKHKLSRAVAATLIVVLFFTVLSLVGVLIVPVLLTQVSGLILSIPGYVTIFNQDIQPTLHHWLGMLAPSDVEKLKGSLTEGSSIVVGVLGNFLSGLFHSGVAFVNLVSLVLITPIVAFYLLKDWGQIVTHVNQWLPVKHAQTIRTQCRIIDQTLAGFMHGQINVCLLMSFFYCVALALFGLKFSIVVGCMTGVLVIVPYMGWMLGMLTGVGIAFFQFDDMSRVTGVLGVFLVGMILEGYCLTPKLVGERVGLHPVWIIFGLLAGGALFGFVGVLLAVPVSAVVGVLLRFALGQYLQSSYYLSK